MISPSMYSILLQGANPRVYKKLLDSLAQLHVFYILFQSYFIESVTPASDNPSVKYS